VSSVAVIAGFNPLEQELASRAVIASFVAVDEFNFEGRKEGLG